MAKAEDIMSSPVISAKAEDSVRSTAKTMVAHGIGCVIVKRGGNILGIVTERDILRKVVAKKKDPDKLPLSEVMSKKVVTVKTDAELFEVNKLFYDHKIRRLPVIKDGELKGIITSRNIIHNLTRERSRRFVKTEYSRPDYTWEKF